MKATSSKNSKATRRIDQAAPSASEPAYRVCSVAKSGRVNWAYAELLTIEQAESIAASSRLQVVPAETCPASTRLVPLSPRAAKRLEKMRAKKPAQVDNDQVYEPGNGLFDAQLNNAMWTIEELAKSCGVDLEFSGADQTRTPVLNASIIGLEGESFQFTGETDQGLIEGARKLVAGMIGKLKQFDTMLSERQPAPLPKGLWTIRDAQGEPIEMALYPLGYVPEGCRQAFEPSETMTPA